MNLPEYYDVTYESGDLYVEANDIHENEHYKLTKPDGKNGWFTKKNFVIEPIREKPVVMIWFQHPKMDHGKNTCLYGRHKENRCFLLFKR